MTATPNPNHVEYARLRSSVDNLSKRVTGLSETVAELESQQAAIRELLVAINDGVTPLIDKLQNHPMGKMLLGGN
jgi:hypothetical protein